jgi:hypothetical protein
LINANIWSSRPGARVAEEGLGKAGLEAVVLPLADLDEEGAFLLLEQEEMAMMNVLIYNTTVYEIPLCMNLKI